MIVLDALPPATEIGGIGLAAGAIFFAALAATAFVVFKLLRKTVKMAFRVTIVAVILTVAVVGSISLWWFGSGKTTRMERPRTSQPR
jgi:hypothetical protein